MPSLAPEMRRARMPWSGPESRIAGAGSGEPICAENRPRRLSLGYTRTPKVKPWYGAYARDASHITPAAASVNAETTSQAVA
jgi:hypothetical protein